MGQAAQLQVDNDQAAQLAMEEQQIHPIPGLVDTQAPLPPDEGEAFTQLQQEVFQPLNQGRFQVGFRILVLEVEELQHIRVFDRVIGRNCRSEEHTSELQSLMRISYAVFCLKKKYKNFKNNNKQTL